VNISLTGGATYNNVFWAVIGQTTIGSSVSMSGIIVDGGSVLIKTGSTITGRVLSSGVVSLQSDTINAPAVAATSTSTTTPEFPGQAAGPVVLLAVVVAGALAGRLAFGKPRRTTSAGKLPVGRFTLPREGALS